MNRARMYLMVTIPITIILIFAAWGAITVLSHGAAQNEVIRAKGYWSATPGWPFGADVVMLHEPLSESQLARVIDAQRRNRSLHYLSLHNQLVTTQIATSVASLKSIRTLDITTCRLASSEADILIRIEGLNTIYADATAVGLLRDSADRVGSKIDVVEMPAASNSNASDRSEP